MISHLHNCLYYNVEVPESLEFSGHIQNFHFMVNLDVLIYLACSQHSLTRQRFPSLAKTLWSGAMHITEPHVPIHTDGIKIFPVDYFPRIMHSGRVLVFLLGYQAYSI